MVAPAQALLAICTAGAIAVPLNLRWSLREAEAAVALVSARLVCMEQGLLPVFGQLGQVPGRACLVLDHSPPQSAIRQQSGSRTEQQAAIAGRLQLRSAPDNAALICFTSGTSGSPKGVLLSHASLHAQVTHLTSFLLGQTASVAAPNVPHSFDEVAA